ncbi:MAG: hypothetical protein SFV19_16990 [Rhodospirillaceae bacterium]|nr:hypothetical protein [Rhodospirillaceae bacterium]
MALISGCGADGGTPLVLDSCRISPQEHSHDADPARCARSTEDSTISLELTAYGKKVFTFLNLLDSDKKSLGLTDRHPFDQSEPAG